ncbi:MAG: type II toxin-antitoxin system VapC family toxin [Lentisphaeria bacterium]|nr:type II toxin-antitoxin system VapC family toxin [Lentisphaeria bacterium]
MLFDTDVLIWALRGDVNAAKVIDETERRYISAVNYMELMQGARDKTEQRQIKNFLAALEFEVLPINEAVSHRASIFIEEYALKSGIQLADALVFATACEHSQCLCSANQKHFRVIESLESKVFKPHASKA